MSEFPPLHLAQKNVPGLLASLRVHLPLVLAAVLACSGAWADDTETTLDKKPVAMEKITVTANKMEEDLIKVPQSITVIDEVMLEEKGIKSVPDLIREIPNMTVRSSTNGNSVNFRGLNPSMFTSNTPVVIYIDGVAHSGLQGFDASLANAERVEILRGPQGTLYGKDAIGAVINIVTKKPDNDWHGKIGTEYGSENYLHGVFNANGALLEDKIFIGLNGQYSQDDGWITNDNPGRDDKFNKESERRVNLNLTMIPTKAFSARLSVTNEYTREYGLDGYGLPAGSHMSDFSRSDAEHVDIDAPNRIVTENNSQSLGLTYDFGPLSLDSVTTHKLLNLDAVGDFGLDNNPLYSGLTLFDNTDVENWTQELRLSSNNDHGLRWVAGLYFETECRDQGPYGQQFPAFNPVTHDVMGNFEMNAESRTDSTTLAAFGQVMIPFAEQFELTLGGRYQRIEKEIDMSVYYLPLGMSGPSMFDFKADKAWYAFLPKAALAWQFTDGWNTYVSYSKGYMPGGFNYFASGGGVDENSFKPQISSNYEWGVKGVFERWSVAASVFYMDIEDIHIYKTMGSMWLTDNAKKAHSQGVEFEANWRPLDGLELTGALGLIEAKYDDYNWGGGNYNGQTIEQTPAYSLRGGVAYTHPGGFYGRIDAQNQGKTYFYDGGNNAFAKQDSYTVVDAKIGYRLDDWDFYAFGRNLTDEEYVTMYMSNSMFGRIFYGNPRSFGVGVSYYF